MPFVTKSQTYLHNIECLVFRTKVDEDILLPYPYFVPRGSEMQKSCTRLHNLYNFTRIMPG